APPRLGLRSSPATGPTNSPKNPRSSSSASEQARNLSGDNPWFIFNPPLGQSDHPVTGGLQRSISSAIALKGRAVAMERKSVEFDAHPLSRPDGIDLHPLDGDIS